MNCALRHYTEVVRGLEPGQHILISRDELAVEISSYYYNGAWFHPWDRILENIVGSAYEYGYYRKLTDRNIEFYRLEEPLTGDDGRRTYTSPDRRGR